MLPLFFVIFNSARRNSMLALRKNKASESNLVKLALVLLDLFHFGQIS